MLLPETAHDDAVATICRLRPWSFGVAQIERGEDLESALQRADAAMYDHKRG